jgi:competence ComEA-like helix-hairpin-helix protein
MLYTRPQLILLLILLGAAGCGLAVGHWRTRHPDLVERFEQLDRERAVTADAPASGTAGPSSTPAAHERARSPASPERRPRPAKLTAPPAEASSPTPLDLNEAGVEDLSRLPGIGSGLAERIVAAREAAGRFASVDDLRRVRGVGRAKLQRLRALVTVEE